MVCIQWKRIVGHIGVEDRTTNQGEYESCTVELCCLQNRKMNAEINIYHKTWLATILSDSLSRYTLDFVPSTIPGLWTIVSLSWFHHDYYTADKIQDSIGNGKWEKFWPSGRFIEQKLVKREVCQRYTSLFLRVLYRAIYYVSLINVVLKHGELLWVAINSTVQHFLYSRHI